MGKVYLKSNKQYLPSLSEDRYLTRAVTYSKISGDDVLDYAEMNSGINRGQLAASMHAIVQSFYNFVCNGHSVELPEVGIFRFGVNAKSVENEDESGAEQVYRRKVLYRPSTKIKSYLNSMSLVKMGDDEDEDADTDSDEESTDEDE